MTTGFQIKLGRLARSRDPRVPHMSALMAGIALPAPPAEVDWTKGMPANLGMMLNDALGDCTCAAFYHALQVWTFNASGKTETETDADVERLYELACGYNPAQGGEGPGGNEQHVLTYLLNEGAPTVMPVGSPHKIAAFVEIDPRSEVDVKRAIADCGLVYIGFNVPAWLMPANAPPPQQWRLGAGRDNAIIGGHAVILAGYNAGGLRVISWGQYYAMGWGFFAEYVDEVYAIADSTWIDAKGKTPGGLSLAALEEQMAALKEQAG